jgi:hypothetical protein
MRKGAKPSTPDFTAPPRVTACNRVVLYFRAASIASNNLLRRVRMVD